MHIIPCVREHELRGLRLRFGIPRPACKKGTARLSSLLDRDDRPLLLVGRKRLARPASGELGRRRPLPLLPLATHLGELGHAVLSRDPPKRRPRLDRLQLLRVPDQNDFRVGLLRHLEHPRELPRADHSSLIDDQNIFGREGIPPPAPRQFIARQRARLDARRDLQILRGNARERRPLYRQTFRLPGLAHRRKRRALARPGDPDQGLKVPCPRHVLKGLALLLA